MPDPTPAEIEAVKVLIAHGRTRIEGCDCGWGMDGSNLGQSHALHVWRELQRAVLPDHDARIRADHLLIAERVADPPQVLTDAARACATAPEEDTDG